MKKIIDIRANYLYNFKHIKDSVNIPWQLLLINPLEYLNKSDEYYLICEYGHQSKMVSDILNKNGFNTHSIIGGINKYNK